MSVDTLVGTPAPAAAPAANTTPAAPAATPNVASGGNNGHTQEVRAAETTTPEASKFSADILEQAKTFGVDVSGFSDEANANYAIRQAAERYAAIGLSKAQQQQQPAATDPLVEDDDTDDVDINALDPKVAAYFDKIKKQADAARREAEQFRQQQYEAQEAQNRAAFKGTIEKVVTTIDSFALPEFGVGEHLTVPQQIARRNLMETTAAVVNGLVASGLPVPSPEAAVRMALTVQGKEPTVKKGAQPKPGMAPGGTLAPGAAKPTLEYFKRKPEYDALGITQTEEFQRGLAEIIANHS